MTPEALKAVAEHILFVSEVRQRMRCPVCHGKPAVERWRDPYAGTPGGRRTYYGCGCGHQWNPASFSEGHRLQLKYGALALLDQMAKTGELPEIPEKESP